MQQHSESSQTKFKEQQEQLKDLLDRPAAKQFETPAGLELDIGSRSFQLWQQEFELKINSNS